jgi:large subunit ribosomal protein L32
VAGHVPVGNETKESTEMAVPKKKNSRQRRDKRRANWSLRQPDPSKCPHCGAARLPHRVCRECGYYGEREVLVVES